MDNRLEIEGSIKSIRYAATDSDFKIAEMRVSRVIKGEPQYNEYGSLIFKGEMDLTPSENYIIQGDLVADSKYGKQYKYLFSKRSNPVEGMTAQDFRRFLTTLSPKAVNINAVYKDPREIFEKHDLEALTKVEGIGGKTAQRLLEKYEAQRDYSPAYVAFGKWGFTIPMTRKLVRFKKSVDAAVKALERNPYEFMRVPGVGFKTIDKRALESGMASNDTRRVRAFVQDFFDNLELSGSSWADLEYLKKYLRKEIFNCDVEETVNWINEDNYFVVYEVNGKKRVSTTDLYRLEEQTARDLVRLVTYGREFKYTKDPNEIIQDLEAKQGWRYSQAQRQGIDTMLNGSVSVLRGTAGSGKTSSLNGVVKVLQANGYHVISCALSGKAADNLTQVTGRQGSTIHRLLRLGKGNDTEPSRVGPVIADVVIVDEISMVDVRLFQKLVSAIPNGTKLILVGDSAQLDSIGVGVMRDIVQSGVAPVITLTEIHRQARESAIITHSLTYRMGKLPKDLSIEISGKPIGRRNDLVYFLTAPDQEKQNMAMSVKLFKGALSHYPIDDIQIVTQMTSTCDVLNSAVQDVANPKSESKSEYAVYPGKDYGYTLREGDKVLNTTNDYESISWENQSQLMPIYNGNTGIIEKIQKQGDDTEFVINFTGVGRVLLTDRNIKHIKLGYAITVHKSQGSTIPCVIVVLPFQYMLNSRELLYTAITRAKDKCFVLSSLKTLRSTVNKTSETIHHSNLGMMLKQEMEEAKLNA